MKADSPPPHAPTRTLELTATPSTSSALGPRLALAVILVTSALLRLILVANGGQFFWIDESHRFHPCLVIFDALRYPNHTWTEIADTIALQHLHTGFLLVGIPLAALGVLLMSVVEISSIQTAAAYLLSFTSVATIALVYLVARRLDAGR